MAINLIDKFGSPTTRHRDLPHTTCSLSIVFLLSIDVGWILAVAVNTFGRRRVSLTCEEFKSWMLMISRTQRKEPDRPGVTGAMQFTKPSGSMTDYLSRRVTMQSSRYPWSTASRGSVHYLWNQCTRCGIDAAAPRWVPSTFYFRSER
jgi:hypothetical protein